MNALIKHIKNFILFCVSPIADTTYDDVEIELEEDEEEDEKED